MWRNTHERDSRITFDAENHIYHIDGIQCAFSSTGLVAQFFPKFDMIKVIDQYYDRWQKNNHPKYGGKTKDEILESWADIGEESSVFGTRLHEAVESFYKGEEPYIEGIEEDYALFTQFQQKYPQLIPYRIEWRVGTEPDIGIAGSIDMCFTEEGLPSNVVDIVDWKRTKKQVTMVGFKGQMGLGPLAHLPDTNFYHYSVQLNIYKYILENYYNLKVRNMSFVVLNRVHQKYIVCRVNDLQKEVRDIFEIVRRNRMVDNKNLKQDNCRYSKAKPQQFILSILRKNHINVEQFSKMFSEFTSNHMPDLLPNHALNLRDSLIKAIRGGSRIRYKQFKLIVEDILGEIIPDDTELMNELNINWQGNNLTGNIFGRLTAVECVGNAANDKVYWLCKCICGNEILVYSEALISGNTKSCGCYSKERLVLFNKQTKTVHGMGNVPEFKAWYHMIHRCTDKDHKNYFNYGGRGIIVCDRWLESYENFYEDMGPRPEGMSLDRIDNDGNYEPSNCKWSTKEEQNDNKRRTLRFDDGTPIAKFARENNLSYGKMLYYYNLKYSPADILKKLTDK